MRTLTQARVQPQCCHITACLCSDLQAVYKTYIDVVHVEKSQTARTFTVASQPADRGASQVAPTNKADCQLLL